MNRLPSLAFAALLAATPPACAQGTPKPAAPQAQNPAELKALLERVDAPDPATLKAMKSRVFVLQYANPIAIYSLLGSLGSGVKGARMDVTSRDGLRALSVRDFPENLATMEAAIQRLDVPAMVQSYPDVELQIQVLFASRQAAPEGELPKDLEPVVRSLRSTLGYRSYTLAAAMSQRVRVNGDHWIEGRGEVEGTGLGQGTAKAPKTLDFKWNSTEIAPEGMAKETSRYAIQKFGFELKDPNSGQNLAGLSTGLTLKEGEHVVVGTSVVKDRGVIVVLSIRKAS